MEFSDLRPELQSAIDLLIEAETADDTFLREDAEKMLAEELAKDSVTAEEREHVREEYWK